VAVKVTLHQVRRPCCHVVGNRRPRLPTPNGAFDAQLAHQPLDRAAGDLDPFAVELSPNLGRSVDPAILTPHPLDLLAQHDVTTCTLGKT